MKIAAQDSFRPLSLRRFLPTGVLLALVPGCYLMCPYNADQFVETQIRAECHFWFACCTAGEHDVAILGGALNGRAFPDLSQYRDENHCIEERLEEGSELNEVAISIQQAEQAGRFKFDVTAWQACQQPLIDAMNTCNADFVIGDAAPVEVLDSCLQPTGVGLVPNKGDCFFDFECAIPGSDCLSADVLEKAPDPEDIEDPTEVVITRPTICIAPLKEGDDCSIDPERPASPTSCDPGLICFLDSDGDENCETPHQDGDDCNSSNDCDVGLFCNVSEAPPECAELKQDGDDCTFEDECDVGLDCEVDGANQECTPPLPVEVEVCNGVQGTADPTYPSKP